MIAIVGRPSGRPFLWVFIFLTGHRVLKYNPLKGQDRLLIGEVY